ncbi:MAG TPA: alpha/beta hydrolase, partial [Burkholderiales bacterium]|nr:alpha/beta hydrolase [Burkholderiales bacterium]
MKLQRKIHFACIALAALLHAPIADAQSWGPRALDELKQETQRRADRNAPPVGGVKPDDVRAALAEITNLKPDTWAKAFIRIGDQHAARAKSLLASQPAEARELYHRAWETYNLGRWPTENSPAKKEAYAKALEAFAAYGKLVDPPIEVVRIPYEGKEIVGYLRLPKTRPAPLVFGIGGLDSRKEDVAAGSESYIRNGIAVFAVDMPGTGQAPVKADVGAERMFSKALDHLLTRPEIDGRRIIVQGRSWSGYWAAVMAYTERHRLRGVVVQGGPVHTYFTAEWQKKALTTPEYLF